MTTSYKKEAVDELKKQKKIERERELAELMEKNAEEAKAHAENMARIAKKMAKIEAGYDANGSPTEEEPKKKAVAKKKAPFKKKAKKKKSKWIQYIWLKSSKERLINCWSKCKKLT